MKEALIQTEHTDIATIVENNPVAVLVDRKTYDALYAHIKAEADAFVPDLTTETSRGRIKSLAFKVTRTKTAIDAAGKKLNEDARAQIGKVDEQRRKIRDDLDALATEIRKPLTAWEAAEISRQETVADFFETIETLHTLSHGDASGVVRAKLNALIAMTVDRDLMRDRADEAVVALKNAYQFLCNAEVTARKIEADALELERLRAEQDARREAEAKAAQREAEAAQKEAEVLAAKEAEERAVADAAHRIGLATERAREEERKAAVALLDKAEAEKQALIDAQAKAEHSRKAREAAAVAEQAARDANKAHRIAVKTTIKNVLMEHGASEGVAKKITNALIDGQIPNVSFNY